jgi:hypothetical protein
MDHDNLFDLFQNVAVSAVALQSFTHGYHEIARNRENMKSYPRLDQIFFVLPIVYNKNAMTVFGNSVDLYTAILKDTSVTLGLQDRANKMSKQTFDALNLAFAKKVLTWNTDENLIELAHGFKGRRTITKALDINKTFNSVKRIQECAHRLGNIFAKKN